MGPQRVSATCEYGPTRHLEHPTPSGKCPGWQEGWPTEPAELDPDAPVSRSAPSAWPSPYPGTVAGAASA